MPAFFNPITAMVDRGWSLAFVVIADRNQIQPGAGESNLFGRPVCFVRIPSGRLGRAWHLTQTVGATVSQHLTTHRYDLLYAHGAGSAIAPYVAARHGLPSVMRLYGTFLAAELNRRSPFQVAIRHPLEVLALKGPARRVIITDDGTRGDVAYKALVKGRPEERLCFWRNGVNETLLTSAPPVAGSSSLESAWKAPFLLYPGRVARWKGQHRAIQAMAELRALGSEEIHLYCVGHITDKDYANELMATARRLGVERHVHIMGAIPQHELIRRMQESRAVLFAYDVSNMGNALIEAMAAASMIIALDGTGSLDGVIDHGLTGVIVDSPREMADAVHELRDGKGADATYGDSARRAVNTKFSSWTKRSARELDLLEKVALSKGRAM
jgi:glycosyltransferase involved in cell wall biosynthesis